MRAAPIFVLWQTAYWHATLRVAKVRVGRGLQEAMMHGRGRMLRVSRVAGFAACSIETCNHRVTWEGS